LPNARWGNYVEFDIDRDAIARYGLTVGDVQEVLEVALGGMPLTTTVEGLERYTVNLRYSRDFRENLAALSEIVVPTPTGAQVPLGQLAKSKPSPPRWASRAKPCPMPDLRDVKGIDIGTCWEMACAPSTMPWPTGGRPPSGTKRLLERPIRIHAPGQARLMIVIPLTLLLIDYHLPVSADKTAIVMLAVPFSLVGDRRSLCSITI
jgi:Cu(I)/Ag(I) efflux system membrane protein CusA/SilA